MVCWTLVEPASLLVVLFTTVKVCCFISPHAQGPLSCHVVLDVLGANSLIIRPVSIIGGWNHFAAPHQFPIVN